MTKHLCNSQINHFERGITRLCGAAGVFLPLTPFDILTNKSEYAPALSLRTVLAWVS